MAVLPNTTTRAQITTSVREIDFITRFQKNIEALLDIMGVMRPVRKQSRTTLVSSRASVELQDGNVAEGDEVPLSQAKVEPVYYEDIDLEKFRTGVTAETVSKYGAAIGVEKVDSELIARLQNTIMTRFYDFAQMGELVANYSTFQMAVSMAVALVKDKFKKIQRDYSNIVVFANTLDIGEYLGSSTITTQTANGVEYLKNFLGASTVIVTSEIPQNTVLAIPADNIVMYYVDPSEQDFRELGLNYTVTGDTPLLGVCKQGNYSRVMGETHVVMGVKLFAEYIDGIAYVTVTSGTLGSLTVASAAGTNVGDTALTVTETLGTGHEWRYKVTATGTTVTIGQNVKSWKLWDGSSDITAETGKKLTLVEADADYKAVKAGTVTVTAKA